MPGYLMDTNHASSVLEPRKTKFSPPSTLPPNSRFALCMPGVGELWFMVYNSAHVASNHTSWIIFLAVEILEFNADAAMDFGKICTELRKSCRTIKQIDIQIAAIARVNNLIVLTADKHFSYIAGITARKLAGVTG